MLQGQMLSGQMSPLQLKSVQDCPRNLNLKFGQNQVSNSWDIDAVKFVVVVVGGVNVQNRTGRPFWSGRWGVAGGEQVPLAPLGWYYYLNMA